MTQVFRWKVCLICSSLLAVILSLSWLGIFLFGVAAIPNYTTVSISIRWFLLVGGVLSTVLFCISTGFAAGVSYSKLETAKAALKSDKQTREDSK